MKTGTRRFILHLIVGLLAFVVGVSAATLLGGFIPFQSSSSPEYYRHKGCGYHRSWSPPPSSSLEMPGAGADVILLKGPRGIKVRTELNQIPPPASLADSPLPPSPPQMQR